MMKILCYLLLVLTVSGLAQDEFGECPETERPSVWIDNAPDCQANSTYCDHFGLDYLCTSNITDEGNACFGGTQVMCLYPPTTPLAAPLPATTLKVIAYNVWELKYLISQIGQRERTCRIPQELFKQQPDVDVIVFEEMFMGGCIVNAGNNSLTARDILRDYGFVHYTRTVGDYLALLPQSEVAASAQRNATGDNGGVFITSRWPIVKEEQIVFENFDSTTSDGLSAKGVMYARITKTVGGSSKTFNIFGTHMQATEKPDSPGVRILQAKEMHNFMKQMKIPLDEPVVYAGDLNGDLIGKPENALAIIAALNSSMLERIGPIRVTYDKEDNDNLDPTDAAGEFLDYVLSSDEHEQPSKATLQIIRPRSEEAFTVCRKWRFLKFFQYPHSKDCGVTKRVTDLADHYPVVGILDYSKDGDTFSTSQSPGVDVTSGSNEGSSSATTIVFAVLSMIALRVFN